ncbi:hypothetical protein F8M41_016788 [Gigaspora margarita]|uniref:Uncharacterized protein n=2 Tax=Gigaspora margarita TaxID=4874 RepID=A0A8H4EUN1_GIGMA|nr:hypothetical protein F8M41_016788 [Gigaspora margarita]
MARCCCCIPLKAGVIIITLLWLFTSIISAIADVAVIKNTEQLYDKRYYVVDLVASAITFLITTFGLFVTCCAKSSTIIKIYAVLFAILVVIQIAHLIYMCIFIATYHDSYMSTCLSTIKSSNSTDDITGSNACNAEFKKFAAPWVIGYVLAAILSIYFAFVINRYAKHCKSNEKISPVPTVQTNTDKKSDTDTDKK